MAGIYILKKKRKDAVLSTMKLAQGNIHLNISLRWTAGRVIYFLTQKDLTQTIRQGPTSEAKLYFLFFFKSKLFLFDLLGFLSNVFT